MPKDIAISAVLLHLREGKPANITYVRSGRSTKGKLKKYRVIHGYHYESMKDRSNVAAIAQQNDQTPKHKMNGTIPLIDLDRPNASPQFFIAQIIKFNNRTIIH